MDISEKIKPLKLIFRESKEFIDFDHKKLELFPSVENDSL